MAYIVGILESFLGHHRKHNEDSGQVSFDCPACSYDKNMPNGDGKGNLELNYNKDVFKCWVCRDTNDMSGSITRLIKRYGTPKILRDYNLFKPEIIINGEVKKPTRVVLPEGFKLLKDCTPKDFRYSSAISYLYQRGITDDIIEKYNIGYTTRGLFFNRIIVPSYDENGLLNYFIARWFDKKYNKIKYMNPDAEKQLIIFNENKINWDATIYLVEGVTDHIVVPNSIPLLGKFISETLMEKIYTNASANIVVLLDNDALKDSIILYRQLNIGRLRNKIRLCILGEGLDPSKINEKFGKKGLIISLKNSRKLEEWDILV